MKPTIVIFFMNSLAQSGGLERVMATRLAYLSEEPGLEIHVATMDSPGTKAFETFPSGVRIHQLDTRIFVDRSLYSPRNVVQALRFASRVWVLVRRLRPGILVNCNYGFSTVVLPLVSRGAVLINETHSSRCYERDSGSISDRVRDWLEARYDYMIALNELEAKAMGHPRTIVIPNPLRRVHQDESIGVRQPCVIFAGRIAHAKGPDRLIDAWALVASRFPAWTLRIFGDGPAREVEALKARISASGVSRQVALMPATKELAREMASASILALPSRTECLPMVMLEAMQLGLPVVAFDCPSGPRAIVGRSRAALLVEDGNIESFANALVDLMEDPMRRMELAAEGQDVALRYASASVLPAWSSLIRDAVSERDD